MNGIAIRIDYREEESGAWSFTIPALLGWAESGFADRGKAEVAAIRRLRRILEAPNSHEAAEGTVSDTVELAFTKPDVYRRSEIRKEESGA